MTLDLTVGPWGNERSLGSGDERLNDPFIGVMCLVGKERVSILGPCSLITQLG